ncbi:MAG: hypothetical protein WCW56_02040 [Candidatus Paceibacterota bacterium]|jgi:hypothetical protein
MELINSFLDRYKGIGIKDLELKEFICCWIKEKTGIELTVKMIEKKNNKIFIKTKPLNRNEILLYKRDLLKELKPFKIDEVN